MSRVKPTEALNAFIGLAPGSGTETITVIFPIVMFSMLDVLISR